MSQRSDALSLYSSRSRVSYNPRMDAPPVRFVTTKDGYDIAYTICGEGQPFVFMPFPNNHLQLNWQSRRRRDLMERLSAHFKLVLYDSRGQGMSTRGLPENHSLTDYVTDL